MTAIQLKTELVHQIDSFANDESMLAKVLCYVKNLRASQIPVSVSDTTPYTLEELESRISMSLEQVKDGKIISKDKANQLLETEFEWLR
jgi:hypothetical protein